MDLRPRTGVVMPIEAVQMMAIMFTVLALIPGGAHLTELPNKMRLERPAHLTVQQIYRGWSRAGVVLLGALVTTLWLAIRSRFQLIPLVFASSAFALLLTILITFFVWVYPVNKATAEWTIASENFEHLRAQWEYTHAANALLTLLAVRCDRELGMDRKLSCMSRFHRRRHIA